MRLGEMLAARASRNGCEASQPLSRLTTYAASNYRKSYCGEPPLRGGARDIVSRVLRHPVDMRRVEHLHADGSASSALIDPEPIHDLLGDLLPHAVRRSRGEYLFRGPP